MGFDRVSLKLEARSKCRGEVLKVTLIYLLLSSLIPSVLALLYGAPFDEYVAAVQSSALSGNLSDSQLIGLMQTYLTGSRTTLAYFCSVLIGFLIFIIQFGYYGYALKVARNQQNEGVSELFSGFRMVGKLIWLNIYTSILIFLWSLLFVIPGIIAAYRYRMAPYILLDHPELPVTEAVNQSKAMMMGNKWNLFVFDLSFIGWAFLAGIVGGIGTAIGNLTGVMFLSVILEFAFSCIVSVWLSAYMQIAEMNIYDVLSGHRADYGQTGPDSFGDYHQSYTGDYNNTYGGSDYQPQNDWNRPEQNDDPWN